MQFSLASRLLATAEHAALLVLVALAEGICAQLEAAPRRLRAAANYKAMTAEFIHHKTSEMDSVADEGGSSMPHTSTIIIGGNDLCSTSASDTVLKSAASVSGTHSSTYLGCYLDKKTARAFPFELPFKGHTAFDCERECSTRGYRFFGREFKGQCFCGNEFGSIVKHGEESGCDCCGTNVGAGKMCVWEVSTQY